MVDRKFARLAFLVPYINPLYTGHAQFMRSYSAVSDVFCIPLYSEIWRESLTTLIIKGTFFTDSDL